MKECTLIVLLLTTCVTACSNRPAGHDEQESPFRPAKAVGKISDKAMDEISGMAAGASNPGMLWMHNDSGDEARIFLIDEKAGHVATYYLEGTEARDWEDIASGPGPESGKNYLYIGDIGDNDGKYAFVKIHRVEEPVRKGGEPYTDTIPTGQISTFVLRYEDGPRDAETLLIDPLSGNLCIVTKREKKVRVYEAGLPARPAADTLILENKGKIPYKKIVGGDISADGTEVLLKNYTKIWYWKRDSGQSVPELLQQKPRRLPYDPEPQGEAITWKKDGSGFFTLSEKVKGIKPVLYYYSRK